MAEVVKRATDPTVTITESNARLVKTSFVQLTAETAIVARVHFACRTVRRVKIAVRTIVIRIYRNVTKFLREIKMDMRR